MIDGKVFREGQEMVVQVSGLGYSIPFGELGVICQNPEEPEEKRVYEKRFEKKKIFLSREYDEAVGQYLSHPDSIVLSMNGYSTLTPEFLRQYSIQPRAYEHACAAILRCAIRHLQKEFTGVHVSLIDGASPMGVDEAIHTVAREFNIQSLGFSCPEFALWVKDDEKAMYIAATTDEYADTFIRSLTLLISTGGREHALKHDVLAACLYGKRIHFLDVLSMLSSSGTVPATIVDGKGRRKVENAAAAFGRNLSFLTRDDAAVHAPPGGDKWDAVFTNIKSVVKAIARETLSPARKFGG